MPPSESASERLRKKLAGRAKSIQSSGTRSDSSCSVSPPTDPKILDMLQDAHRSFDEDKQKATVLFRLAARKGYVPALILLVSKAHTVKDDVLVIDTLFALLLHDQNLDQLSRDMLNNYADQLALLLKYDKHAEVLRTRKEDILRLVDVWPSLREAARKMETNETFAAIQQLCKGGPNIDSRDVDSAPDELAFLQELCRGPDAVASKANTADLLENIRRLDEKARDARLAAGICSKIDPAAQFIKGVLSAKNNEGTSGAKLPSTQDPPARGTWQRLENGWSYSAVVQVLASLSDGLLQISDHEIKLSSESGELLLHEPMPYGCCASAAEAKWSHKLRQLTVILPASSSINTNDHVAEQSSTTMDVLD